MFVVRSVAQTAAMDLTTAIVFQEIVEQIQPAQIRVLAEEQEDLLREAGVEDLVEHQPGVYSGLFSLDQPAPETKYSHLCLNCLLVWENAISEEQSRCPDCQSAKIASRELGIQTESPPTLGAEVPLHDLWSVNWKSLEIPAWTPPQKESERFWRELQTAYPDGFRLTKEDALNLAAQQTATELLEAKAELRERQAKAAEKEQCARERIMATWPTCPSGHRREVYEDEHGELKYRDIKKRKKKVKRQEQVQSDGMTPSESRAAWRQHNLWVREQERQKAEQERKRDPPWWLALSSY